MRMLMAYDERETGLTVEDRGSKLGLPQNQDAEANVLAAMLLSPEVVEEAAEVAEAETAEVETEAAAE